jgi:diguanylate cyclase (GGDEF)-like protein
MTLAFKKNIFERPDDDSDIRSREKFLRSLNDLESDFKKIEDEVGAERCDGDPRCLEAKLSVELYKAEHDNAGAFKFKRFERGVIEAFDRADRAEGGATVLPPELAKKRYIFVAVNELDRLNKEGHSQAAGDAGLEAAIKAIDAVCLERLGAERAGEKNIFRYGGNEFCVELDGATDEEIRSVSAALVNADLDLGDYARVKPPVEPPPLAVAGVDLREVFETMMSVDAARASVPDNPLDLAVDTVAALQRAADYNLEVAKFVTKIDRAVAKIKGAEPGEAEIFFNDYLRKSLEGTPFDSIAAVREECDKPGFREVVELLAVNAARARFAEDRKFSEFEKYLVNVRLLAISKELEAEAGDRPQATIDRDQEIAAIPRATKGLSLLAKAREKMAAARGTKWEGAERKAYTIEAARRDRGTGLLERGRFYNEWNAQVKEAQERGAAASVVFVDMGFLKYFNDAGGRSVGDAALRTAANLLERAFDEAGVVGEAYRYGGDEFAVRVEGGRAQAGRFVAALRRLNEKTGRIPNLAGLREQTGDKRLVGDSRFDYAPTELVFNAGIAELEDFRLILNDLRDSGELNKMLSARKISESEFRAELIVKLADASVGYQKAAERFETLLKMMKAPAYHDQASPYYARVESIIRYSQKAIFGGQGGDALLRSLAARAEAPETEAVKAAIAAFVSDRLEKVAQIANAEKELTDKLIELHTVRNRLLNEVERLVGELGDEHERVRSLRLRLDEAEKARADLIASKSQIKALGLDKKAKML